jgi:hypothetical protein
VTTYNQYHEWLFPGDPVDPTSNPVAADATADAILEEVSCRTGIEVAWLQRSVREVLDGLVGLGCLWFLHGAQGQVKGEEESPRWFHSIINYIHAELLEDPTEQQRGIVSAYVHNENWAKGNATFEKKYKSRKPVLQTIKIGKHIDAFAEQHQLSEADRKAMHHDLKWRSKADVYDFVVSCDPYDVLTMSHGRAWPSCMKPGGLFEYGPLTDMAAGSALIWFFRPGADAPSGRVILRPFLDDAFDPPLPAIATGGRLYGSGPDTSTDALNVMLEPWLGEIAINHVAICPRGRKSLALTRAIYSDTDRAAEGCTQSQDVYEQAYYWLAEAKWPAPKFDPGEIAAAAEAQAERYEYRDAGDGYAEEDSEREEQLQEANRLLLQSGSDNIGDWLLSGNLNTFEIYEALHTHGALNHLGREYVNDALENDGGQGDYYAFTEFDEEPDPEILEDLAAVLQTDLTRYIESETEYLKVLTVSEAQALALEPVLRQNMPHPELSRSYTPKELANASVYHAWGDQQWHLIWDVDDLYNIFDIIVTEAGRYVDEYSGVEIFRVLFMPDWFYEECPGLIDILNTTTTLSANLVGVQDARQLDPNPVAWLDDLPA